MRVYVDSCLIIYVARNKGELGIRARRMLFDGVQEGEVCVSPLVRLECCVIPTRDSNIELLQHYERIFGALTKLPITDSTFELAIELRARFNLKTPDALHIATALENGCHEFWTNDKRLDLLRDRIRVRQLPET